MRQKLSNVFLSVLAITVFASTALATHWQAKGQRSDDLPVREEINRNFQFTGFGKVEVSGVAGDVNIETSDRNTVDVLVVRSAATQAELDCYQTVIENTENSLTIRHKQSEQGPCNNIRASQRVRLRVPHNVDVSLKGIGGAVNVERINGVLRLNGIGGRATASHVREARVEGLAKGISLSVDQPGKGGIHVSGVVGQVDLELSRDLNADLRISSLITVDNKTPGLTITTVNGHNGTTRFGTGGPPISISGIVGSVKVSRL